MRNIAFAIWMVGYSFNISWDINNWHLRGEVNGIINGTQLTAICIGWFIWIYIGVLLYERKL
jgi:hypothetical protein